MISKYKKEDWQHNKLHLSETVQQQIDIVEECFRQGRLIQFLNDYNQLVSSSIADKHFSYFGINFNEGKVHSVKFYAHLLSDLSDSEILRFLPTADDYNKYRHLKNNETAISSRSAGAALELKYIIDDKEAHSGFFYHLLHTEESMNVLGFPSALPAEMKSECLGIGVNFEYRKEKKLFKKYYYFRKPEVKIFMSNKFKVNLPEEVKLMEYAESDSFAKLNTYGNKLLRADEKVNSFTTTERNIISYLNDKYQLINLGYGIYENLPLKSIYFFDAISNINPEMYHVSDGDFRVHTLNKIVHGAA